MYKCYNKNYQQMRLLYYVFISFFSSFPYMFRAFVGPSSGVFQAVVFMLPFGSIKHVKDIVQKSHLLVILIVTYIKDARYEKSKVHMYKIGVRQKSFKYRTQY